METVRLTIPNMKSSHCQMTVTNTVTNLGASAKSIAPTQAEIELNNGLLRKRLLVPLKKLEIK